MPIHFLSCLSATAGDTAEVSEKPMSAIDATNVVPIVQTKIVDSSTQSFSPSVCVQLPKSSPPCDECGATIA